MMSGTLYIPDVKHTLHSERPCHTKSGASGSTWSPRPYVCAYAAFILGRAGSTAAANDVYVPAMLSAIGIGIALSIAGRIGAEIAGRCRRAERQRRTRPTRDRDIGRFGEYVAGIVLGVGMIVPFVLTLAEFDYFWIGNAIYLVFALSAFVGTVVKLVAYRRGI